MKKTFKIYIFRHGETTFNRDKRFTGFKDAKLAPEGIRHAKIIAKKLKNKKFQVAFQTRLSRSKDTLREVLKFHPECEMIIEDDRMIERIYGDLNGTTHSMFIKKMGKKLYNLKVHGDIITALEPSGRREVEKILGEQEYALIHRGFNVPPPHGESFADVEKRAKSFIKDLIVFMKGERASIAISAHGNSIRLFRKIMEGATIPETCSWFIPYDKVFEYHIRA